MTSVRSYLHDWWLLGGIVLSICAGQSVGVAAGIDWIGLTKKGWYNKEHQLIEGPEAQIKDLFPVLVKLTKDPDFLSQWYTQNPIEPKAFDTARPGEEIYVILFFANPARDSNGKGKVSGMLTVTDAAGNVETRSDIRIFSGQLTGPAGMLRIAQERIRILVPQDAAKGQCVVKVAVTDHVRGTNLTVSQKFDIK